MNPSDMEKMLMDIVMGGERKPVAVEMKDMEDFLDDMTRELLPDFPPTVVKAFQDLIDSPAMKELVKWSETEFKRVDEEMDDPVFTGDNEKEKALFRYIQRGIPYSTIALWFMIQGAKLTGFRIFSVVGASVSGLVRKSALQRVPDPFDDPDRLYNEFLNAPTQ